MITTIWHAIYFPVTSFRILFPNYKAPFLFPIIPLEICLKFSSSLKLFQTKDKCPPMHVCTLTHVHTQIPINDHVCVSGLFCCCWQCGVECSYCASTILCKCVWNTVNSEALVKFSCHLFYFLQIISTLRAVLPFQFTTWLVMALLIWQVFNKLRWIRICGWLINFLASEIYLIFPLSSQMVYALHKAPYSESFWPSKNLTNF